MYHISSNADRSNSTCFFFCYISINCLYISGAYPKCIMYHPTTIGATRAFLLLFINQLPVEWSVPKIYYISSNADRSDSTCFFFCYISINRILEWSVPKIYYISSNADRSDSRFAFVISFNCL
jgi:hypothetical protein